MRALQLTSWGRPAELRDVPVPTAGSGEVVIKVAAAGACHSDLHLMEWPEGTLRWPLPFTLGHENAGWVHELGAGVTGLKLGQPVLVYGAWGCGCCVPCRLGRENYCDAAATLRVGGGGLGTHGGMADFMRVPSSRWLVPLDDVDPVLAAPLTDAALTPYHAIKSSLPLLTPGSTAVVIGTGGLGQMAVQLLRELCSAQIIAIDLSDEHLTRARALGTDHALKADADVVAQVRQLSAGRGADVVLDIVGSDATLAQGARMLRAQGKLVIMGLAMGKLPINFFALPYGAQVATTYWGTITELVELVELVKAGRIELEVERFALSRATEAYAQLRTGAIRGRAVVVPD